MRAYFRKVYGCISNENNDRILWVGLAACVALPMIGIFDEHEFRPLHYFWAITFFTCFSLYGVLLSHHMYNNKANFPESEHKLITNLKNTTYGLIFFVIGFLISLVTYGTTCRITPAFEWITGIYLLNFYSFLSFANPYYDSIHDPNQGPA